MRGQAAFTLAEVLITLGVIGVVAAMTIPTLMTKIQQLVFNSQFRAAYSKIYHGMRLIEENYESIPACSYSYSLKVPNASYTMDTSACAEFYDKLSKSIKTTQICEGNAYNDGCIPNYKEGFDTIKIAQGSTPTTGCSDFYRSSLLNQAYAYVLLDGVIIIVPKRTIMPPQFLVDINGKKGPNRFGYDIFGFILMSTMDGGGVSLEPAGDRACAGVYEEGGRSPVDMMKQIR